MCNYEQQVLFERHVLETTPEATEAKPQKPLKREKRNKITEISETVISIESLP